MKRMVWTAVLLAMAAAPVWSASLGSSARTIIPSEVQQIISVDYRALRSSSTAMALKERVLPENLKQFETALRGMGLDLDQDVDQLDFISFRDGSTLHTIGIAQGQFPTMQFGDAASVKLALDTRDGELPSLNTNSRIADLMGGIEDGTVWSVLDANGTQNMMRSALGDASRLADYDTVKKRLVGSRYTMNFSGGVNLDLDVFTSDSFTAGALSSLVKAGVLYRKLSATGVEKVALDSVTVNNDSDKLRLRFKTDDSRFESLLKSDLFAAVSK